MSDSVIDMFPDDVTSPSDKEDASDEEQISNEWLHQDFIDSDKTESDLFSEHAMSASEIESVSSEDPISNEWMHQDFVNSDNSESDLCSDDKMSTTESDNSFSDEWLPKRKALSIDSIEVMEHCCSCKKLLIASDIDVLLNGLVNARYTVLFDCKTTPVSLKHLALSKVLNVSKNFNSRLLKYLNRECVPTTVLHDLEFKIRTPLNVVITFAELEKYFEERDNFKHKYNIYPFKPKNRPWVNVRATCSCTYHNTEELRSDPEALEFFKDNQAVIEGQWMQGYVHCSTCKTLKKD